MDIGKLQSASVAQEAPTPAPVAKMVASAAVDVAPVQASAPAPDKAELQKAVGRINELMKQTDTAVEFSLDDSTGQSVVRVVDKETKNVIRQIPNEETLNFSRNLDKLEGLLIRAKA